MTIAPLSPGTPLTGLLVGDTNSGSRYRKLYGEVQLEVRVALSSCDPGHTHTHGGAQGLVVGHAEEHSLSRWQGAGAAVPYSASGTTEADGVSIRVRGAPA